MTTALAGGHRDCGQAFARLIKAPFTSWPGPLASSLLDEGLIRGVQVMARDGVPLRHLG